MAPELRILVQRVDGALPRAAVERFAEAGEIDVLSAAGDAAPIWRSCELGWMRDRGYGANGDRAGPIDNGARRIGSPPSMAPPSNKRLERRMRDKVPGMCAVPRAAQPRR